MPKRKEKWIVLAIFILVLSSFSFKFNPGAPGFQDEEKMKIDSGKSVFFTQKRDVKLWNNFLENEISSGNLRLATTQVEDPENLVHERYDQYFQGIRIWGAQLIRHLRSGLPYCINGNYYDDIKISINPGIGKEQALEIAKNDFMREEHRVWGEPELVIFPAEKEYYLTYQVRLAKFDILMVYFINAWTGEILFKYNDVKTDATIGLGTGTLSDQKKMSTEYKSNLYYAIDIMRPAKLITGNLNNTENVYYAYYITDMDNIWTDGTAVDAHAYLGWVYDYYYLIHNRKGMNNANMQQVICIHVGTNFQNAFYTPETDWIYFGDRDPASEYPTATALDVVAHEFTHGVTQYSSNLTYAFESGALNEALSDIMGVSCEFFHQPEGYGYLKAEWWEGEDYHKSFQPGRDLSDPSRLYVIPQWGWRYPDHYSTRYILPYDFDNGGVHINMTIVTHWYYLLANGGTNKTSNQSVSGIGITKAEKIAYRGWVYYLVPSSNFAHARSATYQAAVDLYGSGSTEALRVAQAWNAVGVY